MPTGGSPPFIPLHQAARPKHTQRQSPVSQSEPRARRCRGRRDGKLGLEAPHQCRPHCALLSPLGRLGRGRIGSSSRVPRALWQCPFRLSERDRRPTFDSNSSSTSLDACPAPATPAKIPAGNNDPLLLICRQIKGLGCRTVARNLRTKGLQTRAAARNSVCFEPCMRRSRHATAKAFPASSTKLDQKEELPFGACDVGKRFKGQRATTRLRLPRPSSLGRLKESLAAAPSSSSERPMRRIKFGPCPVHHDSTLLNRTTLLQRGFGCCVHMLPGTMHTKGTSQLNLECQSAASLLPCCLQHAPAALRAARRLSAGGMVHKFVE